LGAPFAFWEADSQNQEWETLSRSHNYLSTIEDNLGLSTALHQLSCEIFVFGISSDLFLGGTFAQSKPHGINV
jgi:hypothetical protein